MPTKAITSCNRSLYLISGFRSLHFIPCNGSIYFLSWSNIKLAPSFYLNRRSFLFLHQRSNACITVIDNTWLHSSPCYSITWCDVFRLCLWIIISWLRHDTLNIKGNLEWGFSHRTASQHICNLLDVSLLIFIILLRIFVVQQFGRLWIGALTIHSLLFL